MTAPLLDAVVVGAGPAGLAASRELKARGVEHRLLERGEGAGHCWAHLYDSLRLHTGKHLSGLPGLPLPRSAPLFVSGATFFEYLRRYAEAFRLPIEARCDVLEAVREAGHWKLETTSGRLETRALVIATGILSSPWTPALPGRQEFEGTLRHSVEYRRPAPFAGRRVLVVGAGNSAGEIAPELAEGGADVTIAIRSGARVVPLTVLGLPVQYLAWAVLKLPPRARERVVEVFGRVTGMLRGEPPFPPAEGSPLDSIPLIGFRLVDGIRSGEIDLRGGLEGLTRTGVRFADGTEEPFDDVILATGYRAALGPVADRIRRDARGFALRKDRVTSADQPKLWFVGHNYDATGGISNIRRDAPIVAGKVRGSLGQRE